MKNHHYTGLIYSSFLHPQWKCRAYSSVLHLWSPFRDDCGVFLPDTVTPPHTSLVNDLCLLGVDLGDLYCLGWLGIDLGVLALLGHSLGGLVLLGNSLGGLD